MLKNHKKQLIISSVIILLPVLTGLLLWNKLPDQLPTHWNAAGEIDGYSNRTFAVFGLPLFLLAVHWLCLLVTSSDKKNENQNTKAIRMVLWICPVASILGTAAIYSEVLGYALHMDTIPYALVGLMFILIGNYLPKCKHNYTIGIKLPWTFASEENWNATHRFGGKVWVIGGILAFLLTFLPRAFAFPALMIDLIAIAAIPTVYSYRYMKKHG